MHGTRPRCESTLKVPLSLLPLLLPLPLLHPPRDVPPPHLPCADPPSDPFLRRGKSNVHEHTSLLQIENVQSKEESQWYLGKRIVYIYKAKTLKNGSLYRSMWGRVTRPHGNTGVVRAKFKKNLPCTATVSCCSGVRLGWVGLSVGWVERGVNGSLYHSMWGRVTRPHGNTGVVRSKFKKNLPCTTLGRRVRVFLYPSNI
ncbi:unnamed protein product [Closterium sp. NIES-53]